MLQAIGVTTIALLSNNPDKCRQLVDNGIAIVEQISTGLHLSGANSGYLSAKIRRGGHNLRSGAGSW